MKKKTKENVRNVEEWHLDLGLCKKKVLRKQTKKKHNSNKQSKTNKQTKNRIASKADAGH